LWRGGPRARAKPTTRATTTDYPEVKTGKIEKARKKGPEAGGTLLGERGQRRKPNVLFSKKRSLARGKGQPGDAKQRCSAETWNRGGWKSRKGRNFERIPTLVRSGRRGKRGGGETRTSRHLKDEGTWCHMKAAGGGMERKKKGIFYVTVSGAGEGGGGTPGKKGEGLQVVGGGGWVEMVVSSTEWGGG